jgi:hypothetical protein
MSPALVEQVVNILSAFGLARLDPMLGMESPDFHDPMQFSDHHYREHTMQRSNPAPLHKEMKGVEARQNAYDQ